MPQRSCSSIFRRYWARRSPLPPFREKMSISMWASALLQSQRRLTPQLWHGMVSISKVSAKISSSPEETMRKSISVRRSGGGAPGAFSLNAPPSTAFTNFWSASAAPDSTLPGNWGPSSPKRKASSSLPSTFMTVRTCPTDATQPTGTVCGLKEPTGAPPSILPKM